MKEIGTVCELRAGGRTHFLVHAPQAPADWADGLSGMHSVRYDEGRAVLTVEGGSEDVVGQSVLAAALRTGPVHEFTRTQPSVTQLFREVVSA